MTRRVGLMVLVPFVGLAGLLFLQSPSNDRNWAQNHAVLPTVEYDGDIVTVGNVRDFRYDESGAIIEPRYEDRRYDISQLTEVWYGISHFSKFDGLAHSFLSFGFADGQYLALSIEARRTVGQPYDPLRGLFRFYDLIYVLADERDVIGVRSHRHGDRVKLFPIHADPGDGEDLLRGMLGEADELNRAPRFYNTLVDNCITGIFKYAERISWLQRWFDYRILLPGYSDGLILDMELLWPGVTLEEARRRATIDPADVPLDSEQFSLRLRQALEARKSG